MFLNEKVTNLFLVITGTNLKQACQLANINYIQGRKYLSYWREIGLVTIIKRTKVLKINYTAKGKRVEEVITASKTVLQNLGVQFIRQ